MELTGSRLTVQTTDEGIWLVTMRQTLNDFEFIEFTIRLPQGHDNLPSVQARAIDRAIEILEKVRPRE